MLTAAGVFLLAALVDYFYVHWAKAATTGKTAAAVTCAVLIQLAGVAGLLLVVGTPLLLLANAAGHGLGSYLGMRYSGGKSNNNDRPGEATAGDAGGHNSWELLSHHSSDAASEDGRRSGD